MFFLINLLNTNVDINTNLSGWYFTLHDGSADKWSISLWRGGAFICNFLFLFFFLFFFYSHTCDIGKFLGQGLNQLQPMPQPHWIQTTSITYASPCNNNISLTHLAKPGIEPVSSQTLCWVLNQLGHNGNSKMTFKHLKENRNLETWILLPPLNWPLCDSEQVTNS